MDGLTPLTEVPADTTGHSHVFLGRGHDRSERRTWWVIALCAAMMVLEIVGGLAFGSIALVADGLHKKERLILVTMHAQISMKT